VVSLYVCFQVSELVAEQLACVSYFDSAQFLVFLQVFSISVVIVVILVLLSVELLVHFGSVILKLLQSTKCLLDKD